MVIEKRRTQLLISHVAFGAISATRIIVTMFLKQRAIARYSWNGVMCPFVYVHVASTAHQWYISRIADRCHGYSSRHVIWTSVKRDLRPNVRDDKWDEQSRPRIRLSRLYIASCTLRFMQLQRFISLLTVNRLSLNEYIRSKSHELFLQYNKI